MRFSTWVHRLPAAALVTAVTLAAALGPAGAETFNGEYTVDDTTNTGPQVYSTVDVAIDADGTFNVFDGRLVRSTGTATIARAFGNSVTGTVNVRGNYSRFDVASDLIIGANDSLSIRTAVGALNIEAGGRVRAGFVRLPRGTQPCRGAVTVSGPGSLLESVNELELRQDANHDAIVTIRPGGTVSIGTVVQVLQGSPRIVLDGGTLSLTDPSAVPAGGIIQFNSGSFRFRSAQTLSGGAGFYTDYFGSPPVLAAGQGLAIDGVTTLATTLRLDGGSLRTVRIAVNPASGALLLDGGTLTLTGEGAVLDSGADFGPSAVTVGDGAGAPALLALGGAGHARLGAVTIAADGAFTFGGETLSVDSLDSDGRVTVADASLLAQAGLRNAGFLGLADAVVGGDVTSPAGSTIDAAGTVVFDGGFTGAAAFYGSGTVVFNGPVSVD
jgi:hypothetical protein